MTAIRPLYISCVFWGEAFRNFFADYLIASLLASRNLPALRGIRPCKLLIATTSEDFEALQGLRIFQSLREYAEPVFLPIPAAPPHLSGCQHMGVGHILATEMAFRDKAYLCALVPDMIVSNGTLDFINQKIVDGYQAVLCTAMRVVEESFLPDVRRRARIASKISIRNGNLPVEISGRDLVCATMENLHSQSMVWDFDKFYFSDFPVAPFWCVQPQTAWIIHSLHWLPLLLDYGAVENHDKTCLEEWTMDGDYLHDNFGKVKTFVVNDSDQAMISSWSPQNDRPVPVKKIGILNHFFKNHIYRANLVALYRTFHNSVFDDTKRQLFCERIYWHTENRALTNWEGVERKVDEIIEIIRSPTNPFSEVSLEAIGSSGSNVSAMFVASIPGLSSAAVRFYRTVCFFGIWISRQIEIIRRRLQFANDCIRRGAYEELYQKVKKRFMIILGIKKTIKS